MHATIHANYRRGLVRRIPNAIFYEYAAEKVTVYGVFHTSQDPDKWRQRLP
jgi:plasmid stabilization system protein ParE